MINTRNTAIYVAIASWLQVTVLLQSSFLLMELTLAILATRSVVKI